MYVEIARSPVPVSVEYLARKANVGWGTAIRYALEMLASGKIQGIKTTRSWIFWVKKEEGGIADC